MKYISQIINCAGFRGGCSASLLGLILFSACSKSPVNIEDEELSAQERAQRYALRVQSDDPSERAMAREELLTFDAETMDWALFWELVKAAPPATVDMEDDYLRKVAPVDCSENAHSAFLEFLMDEERSLQIYLGEPICPLVGNSELLGRVFLYAVENDLEAESGIRFIERLGAQNPLGFLNQAKPEFWNSVLQVLLRDPKRLQEIQSFFHERLEQSIPYTQRFVAQSYSRFYNHAAKVNGRVELFSLSHLLRRSHHLQVPTPTMAQADAFVSAFERAWANELTRVQNDASCTQSCLSDLLDAAGTYVDIVSSVSAGMALPLQLASNERFERKLEQALRPKAELALNALETRSERLDQWLKLRLDPELRLQTEKRSQLEVGFSDKENILPLERVLTYRTAIHAARDFEERRALIAELCTFFTEEGVQKQEFKIDSAEKLKEIPVGCHEVGFTAPLKAKHVVLPFDSVLRSMGENMELEAEFVDASIFDFTAYQQREKAQAEPPPEDAHAVVVPVLLGLRQSAPIDEAPDEIHFFVVHTPLRKAMGNLYASRAPLVGFAGGDLKLKTGRHSFLPTFASLGGLGQAAAPRRQGGRGDQSFLSAGRAARAKFFGYAGPNGEGIHFIPKLSPQEFRDLWVRAEEKGGLPELIFSEEINMLSIPREQKAKIESYCELHGYSAETLRECFAVKLFPPAEKIVLQLIDGFETLDASELKLPFPHFDATRIYSVPGGELGPENSKGQVGERGQMWVEF